MELTLTPHPDYLEQTLGFTADYDIVHAFLPTESNKAKLKPYNERVAGFVTYLTLKPDLIRLPILSLI